MGFKIIIAVILGTLAGIVFGNNAVFGIIHLDTLGKLGYLVIKLLKTLAIPLIFFAIVDAIPRTQINGKHFLRLLGICAINVSVAMGIGLIILNTFHPGHYWAAHHADILHSLTQNLEIPTAAPQRIDLLSVISGFIPESVVSPFVTGSVISVVILALLCGFALRYSLRHPNESQESHLFMIKLIESGFHLTMTCLHWVIAVIPYAVFGMVAQVVGKSGIAIFQILWVFLVVILSGLLIHALLYYPLVNWLVGRKSPKLFFKIGSAPIITALSSNSSLATVPITLKSLDALDVSEESSRLAACIGTNFNNDGITLYEAMAAIFLLQAFGLAPDIWGQLAIVGVAILAGCGIAGIPEAGLIMLPIVLESAGFSTGMVALAIPLIVPVDWIIARVRSMVNVMSDMTVAILLDRFRD